MSIPPPPRRRPCRACAGSGTTHPDFGQAFRCHDCDQPYADYMVLDLVWIQAWPTYYEDKRELRRLYQGTDQEFKTALRLCLGCLAVRLGRALRIDDFDPRLPVNEALLLGYRLGRASQELHHGRPPQERPSTP